MYFRSEALRCHSAGEAQMLAIARALLFNPKLLVMSKLSNNSNYELA